MKFYFVFIFLLTYSVAFARMNQKVYKNGKVNTIVSTPDGGFIITGFIYTNTNNKAFLMKFDSLGSPQWAKSYSDLLEYFSYGQQTIYIPGNGCLFTGVMFHDTISNEEITLAKCDTSGNLLWSREYGNPLDDDEVGSMILTSDGILLAGHSTNFGPGGEDFYLLKTDSSGNLLWSKTFGTPRDESAIILLPYQNGFVMGGFAKEPTGNNNDVELLFLDSSATIVNAVRLGLTGDQVLQDLAIDSSGNLLIAATTETTTNAPHALFMKVSSGGNMLWSKVLTNDFSIPHKISVVPGGCAVTGETKTQLFHENAFILMLDDNGILTGENYFGDSTGLIFSSFLSVNDTLLLTGNYTKPGQLQTSVYLGKYFSGDSACNLYIRNSIFQDVFPSVTIDNWQTVSPATVQVNSIVLGLDVSRNDSIVCDYNSSVEDLKQSYSFSLIPNPSRSKCQLILPFENKGTSLSVVNSSGVTVRRLLTDEKYFILETEDLPSGIYTVLVTLKDLTTSKRLLIQH